MEHHLFKNNKFSTIVYNNFNEATVVKLTEFLKGLNVICVPITYGDETYFSLIHSKEGNKNDFTNHMRSAFAQVLKGLRLQLVTVELEDAIGLVTTTYTDIIKTFGLTIKNVPFLNTKIEGEFIARPKNLQDCYEVMKLAYSNDKFDLVHAEFGLKLENNNALIVTIEKIDRLPVLNATASSNTLLLN